MMEQGVQVFAAIAFLGIGLSHLIQPKAWVAFFHDLAARGTTGAFAEGFVLLNFGAFIAAFHDVWRGPAMVLTIIGWSQLLKGLVRFVAPQVALRIYRRAAPERAWHFQIGGAFALLISGFLWWVRFRA